MCEFCIKHGEGKKWYLQMKNYSDELLHADLSSYHKKYKEEFGELALHGTDEITNNFFNAKTRVDWINNHFRSFRLPAITGEGSFDLSITPATEMETAADKFVHYGQVVPIEDIEKVIDIGPSITRFACFCRYLTTGKADQRYCFGFGFAESGIPGNFPDAASSLEVLDKEEAKKIFRKLDEDGQIHIPFTHTTPYIGSICNCDHDCVSFKRHIEKKGAPTFFRAEYIAQADWDVCTGCKSCMSQCQFGSIFYSSANAKVYIDPTRCYGCGVCRAPCPTEAITLIPRQEVPEAANLW